MTVRLSPYKYAYTLENNRSHNQSISQSKSIQWSVVTTSDDRDLNIVLSCAVVQAVLLLSSKPFPICCTCTQVLRLLAGASGMSTSRRSLESILTVDSRLQSSDSDINKNSTFKAKVTDTKYVLKVKPK